MLDRAQIDAVHWQLARPPWGASEVPGAIVQDLDDLAQCMRSALETRKGSCPLAPERGLDLDSYRDRPMSARRLILGAAVRECLERDVPRVEVDAVRAEMGAIDRIELDIAWRPRGDVAAEFRSFRMTLRV